MQRYTIEGDYLLVIRKNGKEVARWAYADAFLAEVNFRLWAEWGVKSWPAYDAATLYQFQSTYTDAGVVGLVSRKVGRRTIRRWRKGGAA